MLTYFPIPKNGLSTWVGISPKAILAAIKHRGKKMPFVTNHEAGNCKSKSQWDITHNCQDDYYLKKKQNKNTGSSRRGAVVNESD